MILIPLLICCIGSINAHIIGNLISDSDYIIYNEQCKMPNFSEISHELKPLLKLWPYMYCSEKDLLTYTSVKNNIAYLHIKNQYIHQYSGPNGSISCCYSYVRRNGNETTPDLGVSYSECQVFNNTVNLKEDTVLVKCSNEEGIVYQNVHYVVVVPELIQNKMNKLNEKVKLQNKRPMSVIFIVIDGISRLSFGRNMNATKEFLLKNNFYEFIGYNKIDDYTIPNFNALLTGLDFDHTLSICKPYDIGQLDFCPMIWYDFRNTGYATAYVEDWFEIITYLHSGFKNPPTDYYSKPYMEAAAALGEKFIDNSSPYCTGPETQGERVLNVAKDFAVTFKNQPSFGIFWMNTFSHQHVNSPSRFDGKMKDFFKNLKDNGILDESMVILLSDHGVRNGRIRETVQGWYEERLPVNFISVPTWFIEENPEKYKNLKDNSKKLTSTYDMYMTLQEILSSSENGYVIKPSQGCPKCTSLFSKMSDERSCSDAGIPEEWCTCIDRLDKNHVDLTEEVKREATAFIGRTSILNNKTISSVQSTSMTYFHENTYYLTALKTKENVELVLLKGRRNPIKFEKVLKHISLDF